MNEKQKQQQLLSQADCLRVHHTRHAGITKDTEGTGTSVSEAMEDAVLFMVRYLTEIQGPKCVVGRKFELIAGSPDQRRLFLSTARHLMMQLMREDCAMLSVTNYFDLLKILCPDFELRVVKSAFKAAWVVLRASDKPRTASNVPRLPFGKFWKCLELTWVYEPYFLSVRRYIFDSDSHAEKLSAQVIRALADVENYIRRENWPAIPYAIIKDAVQQSSQRRESGWMCHFDGLVRALCVSSALRQHMRDEGRPTSLAAQQAALAAARELSEHRHRKRQARLAKAGGSVASQTGSYDPLNSLNSMDRVTSYNSFAGSLDRTASFDRSSGGGCSPRSTASFERVMPPLPPTVTRSKESNTSGSSGSTSAGSKGSPKPPTRGVIPIPGSGDSRVPHSPADSVSEISAGRELSELKLTEVIRSTAVSSAPEIQPCD